MIRNLFRKGRSTSSESESETAVKPNAATILVVDDSPTEVHILKKILEKQGYEIVTARDGQEGVETAMQVRPDLILMDIVMPVLNGFQATRKLRNDENTAHIPVIMVTTKDQQTDINWGMRQGANEYLVKPIAPAELLGKIRVLLNG